MPFNPEAPFGRVCPPTNGCFFYQNGKHYDIDHNERDPDTGKIIAKAPPKPKPEPAKGPDPLPPPRPSGLSMASLQQSTKTDELDLNGWSDGTVKAPFFKVRAHITKKFGVTPSTADEARAIIRGE